MLALSPEDVGRLETAFALSVARQIEQGPSGLYGPYDGENHLVMIHAPLLLPSGRAGRLVVHPSLRSRAGRVVAGGGSLDLDRSDVLILAAAASLGRRDGGSFRASLFAILLIAAAPIPGILSVMVRPDALAVAFQTWGVVWVLAALGRRRRDITDP